MNALGLRSDPRRTKDSGVGRRNFYHRHIDVCELPSQIESDELRRKCRARFRVAMSGRCRKLRSDDWIDDPNVPHVCELSGGELRSHALRE